MSPRTIGGTGMAAAIAATSGEAVHLFAFAFAAGTVRYTTGAVPLAWDAGDGAGLQTWTAIGGGLTFDRVQESTDLSVGSLTLSLSGVDQTIVGTLLGQQFIGRALSVWLAHLDASTGTIVDAPLLQFAGTMGGGYRVQERRPEMPGEAATCDVTLVCVDRLAQLEERRGIQTNMASHQAHYPFDKFFEFVDQVNKKKIIWTAG